MHYTILGIFLSILFFIMLDISSISKSLKRLVELVEKEME